MKLTLFSKNNLISNLWELIFPNRIFFLNSKNKKKSFLSCDFISLKERLNLETQSIKISNKLILNRINSPYQKLLSLTVKKRTSIEVNKLLIYNYISKYFKKKNLSNKNFKLVVFDTNLSFFLYLKLKKKLNLTFEIHTISIIISILNELFKIFYFLINILIFTHINLIISIFSLKKIKKTNLNVLYNLNDSQKNYFKTDLNPGNISRKINYIFNNRNYLKKDIQKNLYFIMILNIK